MATNYRDMGPDEGDTAGRPGDAIRVLYVDDDRESLERVAMGLEAESGDITVVTESSVGEGLDHIEAGNVDCIISGYELSGRDGLEFLEQTREARPKVPFIILAGAGSEEIAAAMSAGVTDYVQMELGEAQFAVIANRIQRFVENYRLHSSFEEHRQVQQAQFELLVDSVQSYAIFMLDPEGRIASWNRGAENIKGYDRGEILGEHFSVLYTEEDVQDRVPERNLERAVAAGRAEDQGWRVRKDGTRFYAKVTITPIYDDGDLRGFAKVTRDMSRERYFREIERQNERMERFAQFVSHDLKNMVNVAETRLEWSREKEGQVEHVESTLARMRELIEPLPTLARQGRFVNSPEPVPLTDTVRRSWQAVGAVEAELHVDNAGMIVCDQARLRQLFENLFRNAVQHGGDDTTVHVGELDDGFYVEDDGPGIDEANRNLAFELGYTTHEDGTGFGLAIVKEIVEAHGWEIRITEGCNGGTRFEITGVEAHESWTAGPELPLEQ